MLLMKGEKLVDPALPFAVIEVGLTVASVALVDDWQQRRTVPGIFSNGPVGGANDAVGPLKAGNSAV